MFLRGQRMAEAYRCVSFRCFIKIYDEHEHGVMPMEDKIAYTSERQRERKKIAGEDVFFGVSQMQRQLHIDRQTDTLGLRAETPHYLFVVARGGTTTWIDTIRC